MAQWLKEEVGMQLLIPAWHLPVFFLSSSFYLLAFYCLFSLLTLLASRDFCENVFLVLTNNCIQRFSLVCIAKWSLSRFACLIWGREGEKNTSFHSRSLFIVISFCFDLFFFVARISFPCAFVATATSLSKRPNLQSLIN